MSGFGDNFFINLQLSFYYLQIYKNDEIRNTFNGILFEDT